MSATSEASGTGWVGGRRKSDAGFASYGRGQRIVVARGRGRRDLNRGREVGGGCEWI